MKQISLHVYQSIDGCPAPSDKHFDAAVDASSCVLIDEETYLRIYMNHLGWPITAKETLVATNGGIDLTENERVKFIQGDAVAELRQMKEDGTVWWWLTVRKSGLYSWITGWRTKSQ